MRMMLGLPERRVAVSISASTDAVTVAAVGTVRELRKVVRILFPTSDGFHVSAKYQRHVRYGGIV